MKNLLLFLSVIFVCNINAQETFTYSKDGFNTLSVVTEVDSMSAKQIYEKSINWIKETYTNPDKVIKATIENKKVRISGSKLNMSSYMGHATHLRYSIEIAFKDGKYKFDILSTEVNPAGAGFTNFDLTDTSKWYKKNGKMRKWYALKVEGIKNTLNDLKSSLDAYINKSDVNSEW